MRSSNREEILQIGKITGVHGIRGEVKLTPYGELVEFPWASVYITGGVVKKKVKVVRARKHKGFFLVELEGFPTRNDAEGLVGLELSVERDELPELPEDEFYYYDLIGMDVYTEDGGLLGTVRGIIHTGSNDVFEVKGDKGEVLIPAIEEVVLEMDIENKKMTVRLMEGLLPQEGEGE